jgi:hypothetical protein
LSCTHLKATAKQLNPPQSIPLSDLVSAEVRVYLTEEAGCDILVCAQGFGNDEVSSRKTMRRVFFPELDELAEPPNAKHYPYEKTPEEGLNDPFFILHTSGSSSAKGFPTVSFRDPRMRLDSNTLDRWCATLKARLH